MSDRYKVGFRVGEREAYHTSDLRVHSPKALVVPQFVREKLRTCVDTNVGKKYIANRFPIRS